MRAPRTEFVRHFLQESLLILNLRKLWDTIATTVSCAAAVKEKI